MADTPLKTVYFPEIDPNLLISEDKRISGNDILPGTISPSEFDLGPLNITNQIVPGTTAEDASIIRTGGPNTKGLIIRGTSYPGVTSFTDTFTTSISTNFSVYSSNWVLMTGGTDTSINGGVVIWGTALNQVFYYNTQFTTNFDAQIIAGHNSNGNSEGVILSPNTTNCGGYILSTWKTDVGANDQINYNFGIRDAGSTTSPGAINTVWESGNIVRPDAQYHTVRISRIGTSYSAYIDGYKLGASHTDSTFTNLYPGIWGGGSPGGHTVDEFILSGNLTVPAANLQEWQDQNEVVLAKVDSNGVITAPNFVSTVAIGTQPYATTSTTLNTNLNADLLDSQSGAYYLDSANFTGTNWTDLTDGGSTTLHAHSIYVPYTGATGDVDLGANILTAYSFYVDDGELGIYNGGQVGFYNDSGATTVGSIQVFSDGQYGFLFAALDIRGILDFSSLTTSNKTFTFPNASGTIALTESINSNAPPSTVNGITGTAIWSMPFQGTSYKKFLVFLTNFTSAGSVITFPTAFTNTPYTYGDAAAVAIAVTTTTTITLTAGGATAGNIFVEGY